MLSLTRLYLGILFTALLLATFSPGEAFAVREVHKFELLKRSSLYDPYVLFYDIRLKHEGLIKATVTINEFGASGYTGKASCAIQQYKKGSTRATSMTYKKFKNPGTYIVSQSVDSMTLRKCPRFRVVLGNLMTIPVYGTLVIDYPGDEDTGQTTTGSQGQVHNKCDLAVTNLALTGDGRVMVDIKNNGPGEVPSQVWTSSESASVMLFREGKRWGGASIKVVDPQRNLQKPGGTTRYVSNLKVTGPEKITAVVDYGNRIGEANKTNNGMSATLCTPTGQPQGFKPRTVKP